MIQFRQKKSPASQDRVARGLQIAGGLTGSNALIGIGKGIEHYEESKDRNPKGRAVDMALGAGAIASTVYAKNAMSINKNISRGKNFLKQAGSEAGGVYNKIPQGVREPVNKAASKSYGAVKKGAGLAYNYGKQGGMYAADLIRNTHSGPAIAALGLTAGSFALRGDDKRAVRSATRGAAIGSLGFYAGNHLGALTTAGGAALGYGASKVRNRNK